MKPVMAVGLESTLDVVITFPGLHAFETFTREYRGDLARQLRAGYRTVASGEGDEVSIDGLSKEGKELAELARSSGAKIEHALGGNGAQEAATLKALGCEVVFLGGVSSGQIEELPRASRRFFGRVDFSLAHRSEYRPVSYILQAPGTNRYILCEGRGRRMEQLRPYLRKLPRSLESVRDRYGGLDMVSLVGWHVLFGNGLNDPDFQVAKGIMEEIRDKISVPLFTDGGGLASFGGRERRLLCRIYSLFDILSLNEDELLSLSQTLGAETMDEFEALRKVLESLEKTSTAWLHSQHYQASLSTRYGPGLLERAQIAAAAAGVHKVERGAYPTLAAVLGRIEKGKHSRQGLEAVRRAEEMYHGKIGSMDLAATACFEAERFTSTVGAGDVAAAAYIYSLLERT